MHVGTHESVQAKIEVPKRQGMPMVDAREGAPETAKLLYSYMAFESQNLFPESTYVDRYYCLNPAVACAWDFLSR